MGDKLHAKEVARSCGVPVIPGSSAPVADVEEAIAIAREAGYPVLLKAAAGGGGRGMRRANSDEELRQYYELVKNEAARPSATTTSLSKNTSRSPSTSRCRSSPTSTAMWSTSTSGDCSVQRRYQKVVESPRPLPSPSPPGKALRRRGHDRQSRRLCQRRHRGVPGG